MTTHAQHPLPTDREEFLVDGCPRCAEYADELGVHFDPERFRAFWAKMVAVEFDDVGGYASGLDKRLGRQLYLVALGLQRGFGLDPRGVLLGSASSWKLLDEAAAFCELGGALDQGRAVRAAKSALEHVHAAVVLGAQPPEIVAIVRDALSAKTPS